MLALIMALALGGAVMDAGDGEAEWVCALEAEGSGPQVERFIARCPSDHPEAAEIQAAADAALGAVSLPLPAWPGPASDFEYAVADTLVMTRSAAGWRPAPGQYLIQAEPEFPAAAVDRGGRYAACALELRPDAAGVPVAPRVRCLSGEATAQVRRHTETAMRHAAQRMRFAPVDAAYCVSERSVVHARFFDIERLGWEPPAAATDADDLPDLCALDRAALAQQTGLEETPLVALCIPGGETGPNAITGFHLACPHDAPEPARLQAFANEVAAQTGGVIALQAGAVERLANYVTFTFEDGAWTLHEPQIILTRAPEYPVTAARRGMEALCGLAVDVGPDGRASRTRIRCRQVSLGGTSSNVALFQTASRRAASHWLWLTPPDRGGCVTTMLSYVMGDPAPPWDHGRVRGAPQCED